MWKTMTVGLVALTLVVWPSLPVGSAEQTRTIEQLIGEAKTPGEHEAIAVYYEAHVQAARQKIRSHAQMREAYGLRNSGEQTRMERHCDSIALKYEEVATIYEALATLHREDAASARKR